MSEQEREGGKVNDQMCYFRFQFLYYYPAHNSLIVYLVLIFQLSENHSVTPPTL